MTKENWLHQPHRMLGPGPVSESGSQPAQNQRVPGIGSSGIPADLRGRGRSSETCYSLACNAMPGRSWGPQCYLDDRAGAGTLTGNSGGSACWGPHRRHPLHKQCPWGASGGSGAPGSTLLRWMQTRKFLHNCTSQSAKVLTILHPKVLKGLRGPGAFGGDWTTEPVGHWMVEARTCQAVATNQSH